MRPVALLNFWKLKNAFRTVASDPRKYGPILFFGSITLFSLFMAQFGLDHFPAAITEARLFDPEVLRAITFFCMILLSMSVIDIGLGDGLLAFPMPDVDYLFPSPIPRRTVLANRLPALTLNAIFFGGLVLVVYSVLSHMGHPVLNGISNYNNPGWVNPAALFFGVGFYFNLSMFLSIQLQNRRQLHVWVLGFFAVFGLAFGLIWWGIGGATAVRVLNSDTLQWIFKPASLATEVLVDTFVHRNALLATSWLCFAYIGSLLPMFLTKANWYEQSIVSSERITRLRAAAKGGISGVLAEKSSEIKHRTSREYTVSPFGAGAVALFWAHLCAAAKRPFYNFVLPMVGGLALGIFGGLASQKNPGMEWMAYGAFGGIGAYATMLFMQIARTGTEAAIRRRELLSPLPIPGWKAVTANLGVPQIAMTLFGLGTALAYAATRAPYALLIMTCFAVFLPIRTFGRMTLQYLIVLGYPDAADKIQQVVSVGVYSLMTVPFLILEGLALIPGLILQSFWIGIISLTLVQIPIIATLLFFAGLASDRAIATGEPVNLLRLITRRA